MPEHANPLLIMAAAKMEAAAALLKDAAAQISDLNQKAITEQIAIKAANVGLSALDIVAKQT